MSKERTEWPEKRKNQSIHCEHRQGSRLVLATAEHRTLALRSICHKFLNWVKLKYYPTTENKSMNWWLCEFHSVQSFICHLRVTSILRPGQLETDFTNQTHREYFALWINIQLNTSLSVFISLSSGQLLFTEMEICLHHLSI